jgi:hypothetical protein
MCTNCRTETHLQTFQVSQAALIEDVKDQNATRLSLPGEAGYSRNVHTRCWEHDELTGSANFSRLASCVLNASWPQKMSILHSVYLFYAFNFAPSSLHSICVLHCLSILSVVGTYQLEPARSR